MYDPDFLGQDFEIEASFPIDFCCRNKFIASPQNAYKARCYASDRKTTGGDALSLESSLLVLSQWNPNQIVVPFLEAEAFGS
jgi:hypothetical protein